MFSDWEPGQPEANDYDNELCAVIYDQHPIWHSWPCDSLFRAVCEVPEGECGLVRLHHVISRDLMGKNKSILVSATYIAHLTHVTKNMNKCKCITVKYHSVRGVNLEIIPNSFKRVKFPLVIVHSFHQKSNNSWPMAQQLCRSESSVAISLYCIRLPAFHQ